MNNVRKLQVTNSQFKVEGEVKLVGLIHPPLLSKGIGFEWHTLRAIGTRPDASGYPARILLERSYRLETFVSQLCSRKINTGFDEMIRLNTPAESPSQNKAGAGWQHSVHNSWHISSVRVVCQGVGLNCCRVAYRLEL